ncbi:MAG: hypothetical protein KH380_06150 [Coprobacillus sp.]|nr:hypothetical protein [Coprobacillus sp.]
MDSYANLLQRKNYETILLLSKKDNSASASFARIKALIALNRLDEALDNIFERRAVMLKNDRISLMTLHIDLLIQMERYDEARQSLDEYDELPYETYEAEEAIHDLRKIVDAAEKNKSAYRHLDVEEIKEYLLHPKQEGETLFILDALKTMNVHLFLKEIQSFLISDQNDTLKTYLLLVLVDQKVMEEVTIQKHGVLYTLSPYELDPPFTNLCYKTLVRSFKENARDPSVFRVCIDLLNAYILEIYPEELNLDDKDLLTAGFLDLATTYLGQKSILEELCQKFSLSTTIVKAYIEEIQEVLARTPRLVL